MSQPGGPSQDDTRESPADAQGERPAATLASPDGGEGAGEHRRHAASEPDDLPTEILTPMVEEIGRRLKMEIFAGSFASPVPPPSYVREYGEILDTAPERLFKMAERQATHRQTLERWSLINANARAYVGQGLGFAVALFFGWIAYDLARDGEAVAGTVIGTVDLVALVTVFVRGQMKQQGRTRQPDRPSATEEKDDAAS